MMALTYLDTILAVALVISTLFTIILLTLPSRSSSQSHKDATSGPKKPKTSVQVVVLGDIGRSPRMEYHALSIAKHGGRVDLVGVLDSNVHPDILEQPLITILPISQSPSFLQTHNKLLVLLFAPLKAIWQALSLYYVLGYRCQSAEWMLLQNPPFIPTFTIASFVAFIRGSKLIIDWHNFGYSLYALKFGTSHPLVRFHRWYEFSATRSAFAHFTVTNAMARVLKDKAGLIAHPLHDRPPAHFQPLTPAKRNQFLSTFPPTAHMANDRPATTRLIVSSTSWTPDEDFSILLSALVSYSSLAIRNTSLPAIIAVITGKGPQKAHYLSQITQLTNAGKLARVAVHTAWLSVQDYASLLGAADLGVSLHTSSSGLDLPMKVVDMFGTGLPVVGWSRFEAWSELVHEGVNGRGFASPDALTELLVDLFKHDGERLQMLKSGVMHECERRWDDEWDPIAGRLFGLVS